MQLPNRRLLTLIGLFIISIASLSIVPILAQSNPVITIGIQEFQQNFLDDDAFADFEEEFGVDVVTVVLDDENRFFGAPVTGDQEAVDEYLTNTNNFASQADLIPLEFFNNPRAITRTGAFLDITPLMNADPNANLDDFYPAILESVQWDGSTWGLPMSASVQLVIYSQTKFDEAGLAYPDASWTLDDFLNAGEALSEFNAEGDLTLPGFFAFNDRTLLYTELDSDLSDPNTLPSMPLFNTPEVLDLIERYTAYRVDYFPDFSSGFDFDFNEIPLSINNIFPLYNNAGFNQDAADLNFQGALLPDGRAGLDLYAYGISAGSANPELAYELLQYMTRTPEIAYSFFGDVAARQSLANADTTDLPIFRPELDDDLQALVDEALAGAIPAGDLAYYTYLNNLIQGSQFEEGEFEFASALEEAQQGVTDFYTALDQTDNVVSVATPVPTPVLSADEISLTFGTEGSFGQGAGRDVWEQAINDFTAQDPQVGQITYDGNFMPIDMRVDEQDCFYLSSNEIPTTNLSQFLNIDPFFFADTNLDPNNFVNSTIDQVTRDGGVWAMPMSISPNVIWYNTDLFAEAGVPEPTNDWTIGEFTDALNQLDAVTENEPFTTRSFGSGLYIYQLIAAYGGLPIDYNTIPYTINTTDPANVEAIRQTLDLASDGLIDYQELGGFGGGGGGGNDSNLGMFDAILQLNDFRIQERNNPDFPSSFRVVMFPRGQEYLPVSYQLGTGYISANTPAPEACYRWLSFVSQRPELLTGMPAQLDLFGSSVAEINEADDIVALYEAFNEALNAPNVVVIPSPFTNNISDPVAAVSNFIKQLWVNRAFDAYVNDEAPLEEGLANAQQFGEDFSACTADIPPLERPFLELTQEESSEYFEQFLRCALDIDPSLEPLFGNQIDDDE